VIFFADCKDTGPLHFHPNFCWPFFTKKSEEPAIKKFKKTPGQKAGAKISKYLTTNKVFRKF
jgi:hypothetical protein